MWIGLSRLEESVGRVTKARSDLEKARIRLPACDQIWLEAVLLESRAQQPELAQERMARALQVHTPFFI